jgi:hypothetical protein
VVTAKSRRWRWQGCNDGEQRRKAVRADGSAARQGGERPARSGERRQGARVTRGAQRGGARAVKARHMAVEGGGASGRAKTEQSRAGGWR